MEYLNFGWVIHGSLAGAQGPTSRRDLAFLKLRGIGALVRMEERTISGEGLELVDFFEPVPDFTPPEPEQIQRMIKFIDQQTAEQKPVVVSCFAGIGRTGTVLACYLVHRGDEPAEAIDRVRRLRPGSIQTPEQEAAVHRFAEWAQNPGE